MSENKGAEPRTDRSAIARLVHGFGLLLIKGDFERYLDERALFNKAVREQRTEEHIPLDEQHMLKFVPLLTRLGIKPRGRNPHFHHLDVIERLQKIDAFLQALSMTVDFSIEVSELRKRLKRKFENNPTALTLPYKTKNLISDDLLEQCREVMWIIDEFRDECVDSITPPLGADIWSIIIDADRLHRDQGKVSLIFYRHLADYQSFKGDGKPRIYVKTAMAVLLAECFVDFEQLSKKPQIHDRSVSADIDPYGKINTNREAIYESAFADFLIGFIKITGTKPVPAKLGSSLDHYRKILRLRMLKQTPRISDYLASSLERQDVAEIIGILDDLKF